jgi:hypothetical protein
MKNGRPLGSRNTELTRARIQATQLVLRLQKCAMGEVELTREQLKAIEILLKKALPDLSSVELTGSDDAPVRLQGIIDLVRPG